MKFELTEEQKEKYRKWSKKHPEDYVGAMGGATKFVFTITSLGNIIKIKRHSKGKIKKLDLTDYDNF